MCRQRRSLVQERLWQRSGACCAAKATITASSAATPGVRAVAERVRSSVCGNKLWERRPAAIKPALIGP